MSGIVGYHPAPGGAALDLGVVAEARCFGVCDPSADLAVKAV